MGRPEPDTGLPFTAPAHNYHAYYGFPGAALELPISYVTDCFFHHIGGPAVEATSQLPLQADTQHVAHVVASFLSQLAMRHTPPPSRLAA